MTITVNTERAGTDEENYRSIGIDILTPNLLSFIIDYLKKNHRRGE